MGIKPIMHKKLQHLMVTLCKNGVYKRFMIHYLVAKHFINNPNNLSSLDHIDDNKANNHYTNLRWINKSEFRKYYMKKKIDKFIPPVDANEEKWLSIKGYENYIILTKSIIINKETNLKMTPILSGGYYTVKLSNLLESKKVRQFSVHRLVATTFKINIIDEKIYVDHIDNTKTNNNIENLRWVTPAENK